MNTIQASDYHSDSTPHFFHTPIGAYRNAKDTDGARVKFAAVVNRIRDGSLAEQTHVCNRLAKGDKDVYRDYKAKNLIGVTFSGTFPKGKRKAQHLIQHSGLITLDIDDLPPETIPDLLATLARLPQVVLAFVSPSGMGIKAIVHIDPIPTDDNEHKGAYQACLDFFEDLATEFEFKIDTSGSDGSRLCFLAHDPLAIVNENPTPIAWDRDAWQTQNNATGISDDNDWQGDIDITALDFIHPDDSYDTWLNVGLACYNSGLPLPVWDKWSQKGAKYKPNECARKWETFGNHTGRKITWGSVVLRAKAYGYTPKRTYTAPKRLDIDETEQARYKTTLSTHDSNRDALQNAINALLQSLDTRDPYDAPHIFMVKYDTGIGKSHTTLATAKSLNKKVISLLFNHELAAEQTEEATRRGYNAFRFRGRSYNFETSNLQNLPIQMRERNESLFRSKQVMCPVYDKLEPYHEKRLNPYMLCFSCPLLDACKSEGYWSQFPEIRNVDYLSACIQDIVFNPDMWTLFDTFLSGSVPFHEPDTEAEAAIAAMLGLPDSDPSAGTFQPFDFAMIDDYTTAGLFNEARYNLEELKNLATAWQGTHTGDVLKQVFEAILMLYHPDGTQKSVDILTALFDSLDDETREIVNTNLTKHALRDEDGQIIPTSPWTALRNGTANLDTLSPVWHSKDWTLLHQLETIIKHCRNTNQAPMFIDQDGIITLSIPPQVNKKMKAVMLLSATADIDSTKKAFAGQPVTFTVSEGKPAQWADGVKAFQYTNARWTTQSIFEFKKDANGKTFYDDDASPIIVGLRPKAVDMLRKLSELARTDTRKSVFIGYKEFVEGELTELDIIKELHEAFDTVTHYDIAPGRNYDGYKVFVSFGYPKADWSTIKSTARKQFTHDTEPLNFAYTPTTEQGEIYSSTHGRYTDPRVEHIRQQLTTQKLKQALGRARHTRWNDTLTLVFSAEPVPGFTEIATPFVDDDWRDTESFDLDATIATRKDTGLTAESTIADFQAFYGCSERHARRLWEQAGGKESIIARVMALKEQNIGERKIALELGISYGKVRSIVKKNSAKTR